MRLGWGLWGCEGGVVCEKELAFLRLHNIKFCPGTSVSKCTVSYLHTSQVTLIVILAPIISVIYTGYSCFTGKTLDLNKEKTFNCQGRF